MSQVLNEWPSLGKSRYPWTEWMDGQIRRAVQGVDFKCTPSSFQSQLHTRAMNAKPRLWVNTEVDGNSVVFQFYSKEGE